MRNKRMLLLEIRSLIDYKLHQKLEHIFMNLDPIDYDFMDSLEEGDIFKVVLTFDIDKQIKIENEISKLGILIDSKDISKLTLNLEYPQWISKNLVNSFINDNLNIDIILDKINKFGIESLTDVEIDYINLNI